MSTLCGSLGCFNYCLWTICLLGWLNDQTFVRNANCLKSHLNAMLREAVKRSNSSKTMLDENIWSFSRGLILVLTEHRVYITCHSKGDRIELFSLFHRFSKQALWSVSSALLMHWKSFQDHCWTFKNIGGVSWMNWRTLKMRCESLSSVTMHSKCI